MCYTELYRTPEQFDDLLMISNGSVLTGLRFIEAQPGRCDKSSALPIFVTTRHWLDLYFAGKIPDFTPNCYLNECTPFRGGVLKKLCQVPPGKTISYARLAEIIARKRHLERMSAQAIGGAVGWNPICIIIPCHRVIGTDGRITGYNGGIKNKIALLAHEKNLATPQSFS